MQSRPRGPEETTVRVDVLVTRDEDDDEEVPLIRMIARLPAEPLREDRSRRRPIAGPEPESETPKLAGHRRHR